ncbi:condensation domain-containing protein [Spirillospora sp. NPDC047279]|uniref:condensation domain-containing protein n=1 Tax=Spirillospora sp. NPDC047279 TaxID=3155478 RepID=UPI00340E9EE0
MNGPRPLSEGQQALWLLHRMAPDSAAYNVVTPVLLRTASGAPLDEPRLARAVREVAERHELIRSVVEERDGTPVRVPRDADALGLTVLDAGAAGGDDLEAATATATRLGRVPFRLADGEPPVRWTLVRGTADEALLVLVAHHIATDASSQWILLADLVKAYDAPGSLAEGAEPLPYTEHVERERAVLGGEDRARLAAYWREECAGAAALELTPDRPRPARQSFRGGTATRPVPATVAGQLAGTAAKLEVSPFGLLLGTLTALLHRYSGASDGLIGVSVTQRRGTRQRDAVGYLVNSIPVRSRLAPDATLGDAAQVTHRRLLDGIRHARYPLTALLGDLDLPRAPGRTPGFQILVTYVAAGPLVPLSRLLPAGERGGAEVEYGGLVLRQLDVPQMEGQFDLSAELRQGPAGELTAVFRYDSDLFEHATVERLLDHFVRFLEEAVSAPGTPAAEAAPASDQELEQVLAWGAGAV